MKIQPEDLLIGSVVSLLFSAAIFTAGMNYGMGFTDDRVQAQVDSAIENAQLQISDAYAEAEKFRRSLDCVALSNPLDPKSCKRYEPRVRP